VALKYGEYFLQPMLMSLTDKQPEVRQASAYGIGVMAQYGQNAFNQQLKGESSARLLRDSSVE